MPACSQRVLKVLLGDGGMRPRPLLGVEAPPERGERGLLAESLQVRAAEPTRLQRQRRHERGPPSAACQVVGEGRVPEELPEGVLALRGVQQPERHVLVQPAGPQQGRLHERRVVRRGHHHHAARGGVGASLLGREGPVHLDEQQGQEAVHREVRRRRVVTAPAGFGPAARDAFHLRRRRPAQFYGKL